MGLVSVGTQRGDVDRQQNPRPQRGVFRAKAQVAKSLLQENQHQRFGATQVDLGARVHRGPDAHRLVETEGVALQADRAQPAYPRHWTELAGAGDVKLEPNPLDAVVVSEIAQVLLEAREVMVEAADRHTKARRQGRELDAGDARLAQDRSARIDPVGATQPVLAAVADAAPARRRRRAGDRRWIDLAAARRAGKPGGGLGGGASSYSGWHGVFQSGNQLLQINIT